MLLEEKRGKMQRPAFARPAFPASILAMLVLVLIVFGYFLLTSGPIVMSMFGADLSDIFVYSRFFAGHELRQGNFPLWNPYLFCGAPFLGMFEGALLYPFNLFFLCLPLATAINWSIAFHVFLIGLFMYLWAGYSGRSPLSALLASALVMFGGATYLHIFAGQLSVICTMPWAVLVFLSLDGCWAVVSDNGTKSRLLGRSLFPWAVLGSISICIQVFAGHPQTVFVTAIAAGLYAVCKVAGNIKGWRLLLFFPFIYLMGGILSAVQLAAGVAAKLDSVRGSGVYYQFAAMFSFPPENFLSLIIPGFFGDMYHLPYWGRCYLWEMNLFMGVTGIVLLSAGIAWSIKSRQFAWTVVTGILVVLALGKNTPLFSLLYTGVPGFDLFRGSSKFMFPAFLFMAMLAAWGYDRILQGLLKPDRLRSSLVALCLCTGALLLIGALFLWQQETAGTSNCLWGRFMQGIAKTQEGYLPYRHYQSSDIVIKAASLAKKGLITSGMLFFVIGLLLWLAAKTKMIKYVVLLLAVGELIFFARHYQPSFDINRCFSESLARVYNSVGPDCRVLNINRHNTGMGYGVGDLWGETPGVRRRYAELLAFSQGYDPKEASQYLNFRTISPVFKMLRCGAIIEDSADGKKQVKYLQSPLPQAFLVGSCKILTQKDEIMRYVTSPAFNPAREVVLESNPDPQPVPLPNDADSFAVRILDRTTDRIDIAVKTPQPAILVITDAFSHGWKAFSLEKVPARDYVIMPADYALRAIPLGKGQHKIRLIYRPPLIKIGMIISVSGWTVLLAIGALMFVRGLKRRVSGSRNE